MISILLVEHGGETLLLRFLAAGAHLLHSPKSWVSGESSAPRINHHEGGRQARIDCWWLMSLTKSTEVMFTYSAYIDCFGRIVGFSSSARTQASRRRILRPWVKPMLLPCSKARTCFLGRKSDFWGSCLLGFSWIILIFWDWSMILSYLSCSSGSIPISKTSTWALQPPLGFLSHPRSLGGEWIQRHFSIMKSNDPSIASLRQKLIKARGP